MANIITYHEQADFETYLELFGHPGIPLKPSQRAAYLAQGTILAPGPNQALITPPPPGNCHVCGAPTAKLQHPAAYAVAGFEESLHPNGSGRLRRLVTHCDEHVGSDHCSRDRVTPGSGILDGPGGYCDPVTREAEISMALFPGARSIGRFIKVALATAGIFLLSDLALVFSRGQQQADFAGPLNQMIVPGDATANHGFNAGQVLILTGSAPATADAIQSGTQLINWTMNATAFGAPSAATPTVSTAGNIANATAGNTGTAVYGRMTTGASGSGFPTLEDGTLSTTQRRVQFSCGTSGTDMVFNTTSIIVNATCSIPNGTFTITHG